LDFERVRMEPGLRRELGQLVGGLQAVIQVQPALGGFNVLGV
jgi:hypothetical protein